MKTYPAAGVLLGLAVLMSCNSSAVHSGADGGPGGGGGQAGSADAGDAGSGACGTVSACGGDVVGTWNVTQSCLTATEDLSSTCAGATASINFTFSGTATYNADQTYTATSTGGGTTHYHYPSSCLPNGTTCAQFGQLLMPVGMYSSVACAMDGAGSCNCDAVTASTSSAETGTFSTSDGMLTTTHNGMTARVSYCVIGSVMYEKPSADGGGAQIVGGTVFSRQ